MGFSRLICLNSVITIIHFFMAKPGQRQKTCVDYFTAAVHLLTIPTATATAIHMLLTEVLQWNVATGFEVLA
jgi:hypothetical protein